MFQGYKEETDALASRSLERHGQEAVIDATEDSCPSWTETASPSFVEKRGAFGEQREGGLVELCLNRVFGIVGVLDQMILRCGGRAVLGNRSQRPGPKTEICGCQLWKLWVRWPGGGGLWKEEA